MSPLSFSLRELGQAAVVGGPQSRPRAGGVDGCASVRAAAAAAAAGGIKGAGLAAQARRDAERDRVDRVLDAGRFLLRRVRGDAEAHVDIVGRAEDEVVADERKR